MLPCERFIIETGTKLRAVGVFECLSDLAWFCSTSGRELAIEAFVLIKKIQRHKSQAMSNGVGVVFGPIYKIEFRRKKWSHHEFITCINCLFCVSMSSPCACALPFSFSSLMSVSISLFFFFSHSCLFTVFWPLCLNDAHTIYHFCSEIKLIVTEVC